MSRVTTAPATKQATPVAKPMAVPHDRIAMRAYEKWMKRGCPQGTSMQDWTEAEAELKAEAARGMATPAAAPTRR